ncbi:3-phytase [Pacificibacter maritimus]|uniref:3-phytase n=1 Tax=Pacificibacter maritimus TaxID=762213 RepID=A0A3N4TXP0_9RHOB|nr:phytase [Pacificibacter maritimus]RPE63212.1 3-phytase [Pacificibacter maritimus]
MKLMNKAAFIALLMTPTLLHADIPQVQIQAVAETAAIKGDADDPAIWVHPTDGAKSLILGTDKTRGLYVFDLEGREVALFEDGKLNNVDIRPFSLNGEAVWIASAAEREHETLVFYVINADGQIAHGAPFAFPGVPAQMADTVKDIYGSALQSDPETGRLFAWVNFKSGDILQYEVTETNGQLDLTYLRRLEVDSQPEGMVTDDKAGHLYVGEEDVAIWRFPSLPDKGDTATLITQIPSDCFPKDDIEGLTIYDGTDAKYLVASSQGIHRAALFPLDGDIIPTCVGLVEIAAGEFDGVTETDGLDVVAAPLGPKFPKGALVMMDDQNAGFSTNFKIMSWADVATALSLK